jgi:hypothetical protein
LTPKPNTEGLKIVGREELGEKEIVGEELGEIVGEELGEMVGEELGTFVGCSVGKNVVAQTPLQELSQRHI